MEFPDDIQRLIHDFARPMTRADWRSGSFINRNCEYFSQDLNEIYFLTTLSARTIVLTHSGMFVFDTRCGF
jgi:hypothetical protein